MPISRLARNDWLGSSTSPPRMTRSYLSFGPIAALAGPVRVMAAAEVESARKSRRDNADMMLPPICFERMIRKSVQRFSQKDHAQMREG
jgi:hypothetical protein